MLFAYRAGPDEKSSCGCVKTSSQLILTVFRKGVVQKPPALFLYDPQPRRSTCSMFLLITMTLLPVDQAEHSDL